MFKDAGWQFVVMSFFTRSQRLWENPVGTSPAAVFTPDISHECCCARPCRPSPATVTWPAFCSLLRSVWLGCTLKKKKKRKKQKLHQGSCRVSTLPASSSHMTAVNNVFTYACTCSLCKEYPLSQFISEDGLSSWNPIRPLAHFLMRWNLSADYDQFWYWLLLKGGWGVVKEVGR